MESENRMCLCCHDAVARDKKNVCGECEEALIGKSKPIGTSKLMGVVNKQAEDEGLWGPALTATEAYLQRALRDLHRVIEEG